MEDVRAVLDAVGSEQAVLFGSGEAIAQRLGADVADPLFNGRVLRLGYD